MVENVSIVIPEWLTLILGVIGTITGIFSLLIHFIKLRREKPRLRIKLVECFHNYNPDPKQRWIVLFSPHFRIYNPGDRGTTVSKAELLFKIDNRKYTALAEGRLLGSNRIKAHDTVDMKSEIYSFDETIKEQKKIECIFILHHTHGKETIEGVSEMVV